MRLLAAIGLLVLLAGCTEPQIGQAGFDPTLGEPDKELPVARSNIGPVTGEPDKPRPTGISGPSPTAPNVTSRVPQGISDAQVRAVAEARLRELNPRSIREAREYCGHIVMNAAGSIVATPANRGTLATCASRQPPRGATVLASYHTHGRYDRGYDNEVPSTGDMMGDFQNRIDGYVSTPGGRLWHIDNETQRTYELCGLGCLPSDPRSPGDAGTAPVRPSYSLNEMRARQR